MSSKTLYRVAFLSHGKVYEIYCTGVVSSGLWGFVEVSGLVFDDAGAVVVDPTEEKLRDEFADVEVLHLPMQSVLRIEQVRRKGQSVIRDRESGEKVTPFPLSGPGRQGS
ncbi:DUF1820 family protein [Marinihelvus fidelis]|uniref:DUF1820 family protein n=1 Tax=Marinihelvus fidelis TaxID=2613842 RepID=A0A5N0TF18_9GAMM|nr:DUF1820 family protein [Marinihelvus fidelis]KAA9131849.1 DUF1820 family protein [Marinihelvus fidelis]